MWPLAGYSGGFIPVTITDNHADDYDVFLETDPSNHLHIAYQREGNVYYQQRDPSGSVIVAEELAQTGSIRSFAVDASGTPHVLTTVTTNSYYGYRIGSSAWTSHFVVGSADATMDVTRSGVGVIAYRITDHDADVQGEIITAMWNGSTFIHQLRANGYAESQACFAGYKNEDYAFPVIKMDQTDTPCIFVSHRTTTSCNTAPPTVQNDLVYLRSGTKSQNSSYGWMITSPKTVDLTTNGLAQLSYTTYTVYFYCYNPTPWSTIDLFYLGVPYGVIAYAVDISTNNVAGMLYRKQVEAPSLYLTMLVSNQFPVSYMVTTNGASGDADISMDTRTVAVSESDGSDREVTLYLWDENSTQQDQKCCLPGNLCDDLDPFDCLAMGGTPQGSGTTCAISAYPRYADVDGDGYGVEPLFYSCVTNGALVAGDCDDNNPAVHPGSDEICDGIDNDCDGGIDVGHQYYVDADGDGYGVEPLIDSCLPLGALVAGDCNDSDPSIHPAAIELCDGVDNNCNGTNNEGSVCSAFAARMIASNGGYHITFSNLTIGATSYFEAASGLVPGQWDVIEEYLITSQSRVISVFPTNHTTNYIFRLRYPAE